MVCHALKTNVCMNVGLVQGAGRGDFAFFFVHVHIRPVSTDINHRAQLK